MNPQPMARGALILGLFALACTGLVAGVHELTRTGIERSQRAATAQALDALVDPRRYDNDPVHDVRPLPDPDRLHLDQPEPAWRARRSGQPVAVIFPVVAPDGYSGRIRLLVAVNADGTLAGVQVLAHKETPGLGDVIEAGKSGWLRAFTGKSLSDPDTAGWRVRKDGGRFDQLTGATVTPRAVVRAVHDALLYYHDHRPALFAAAAPE